MFFSLSETARAFEMRSEAWMLLVQYILWPTLEGSGQELIFSFHNKLACSQVSSKVSKLVGSQVYSKVSFLVKYKIMNIILVVKHRSSFSPQNSNFRP